MIDIFSIKESGTLIDGRFKLLQPIIAEGTAYVMWLASDINVNDHTTGDGHRWVVVRFFDTDNFDADTAALPSMLNRLLGYRDQYVAEHIKSGMYGDVPFLVTAYYKNGSLADYIGNVNESEYVWKLILDLTSAIQYLHDNAGILHQNITPPNVLINDNGDYLLDGFGYDIHNGSVDDFFGGDTKQAYMAPELFSNNGQKSVESDIWALGAVLYEAITGRPPFGEDGGESQWQKKLSAPAIDADIDSDIKKIVSKCLSLKPDDRLSVVKISKQAQKAFRTYHGSYTLPQKNKDAKTLEIPADIEAESRTAEEAAYQARLEAERKAAEEAAHQAQVEAEHQDAEKAVRQTAEEAAHQAQVEAERKAAEEAEIRRAKMEAERKADEIETLRHTQAEAERYAAEEVTQIADDVEPEVRAVEHQWAYDDGEVEHKSSIPKALMIILVALVVIGGGVAAYFMLADKFESSESEFAEEEMTIEKEFDNALTLLNSSDKQEATQGLALMDSLSDADYIPAMYEVAFTYGGINDPVSISRKDVLGIKYYTNDPNNNYLPTDNDINKKAAKLFAEIGKDADPDYPEINAQALYRLSSYYLGSGRVVKTSPEKAKRILLQARDWAQKTDDKSLIDKIQKVINTIDEYLAAQ